MENVPLNSNLYTFNTTGFPGATERQVLPWDRAGLEDEMLIGGETRVIEIL